MSIKKELDVTLLLLGNSRNPQPEELRQEPSTKYVNSVLKQSIDPK